MSKSTQLINAIEFSKHLLAGAVSEIKDNDSNIIVKLAPLLNFSDTIESYTPLNEINFKIDVEKLKFINVNRQLEVANNLFMLPKTMKRLVFSSYKMESFEGNLEFVDVLRLEYCRIKSFKNLPNFNTMILHSCEIDNVSDFPLSVQFNQIVVRRNLNTSNEIGDTYHTRKDFIKDYKHGNMHCYLHIDRGINDGQ